MSKANYFTFIRLLTAPLFLLVYTLHAKLGISPLALPCILLGLLTISELSDLCDGYVARKYNEVTDLGKILDPMADSIYRITVFLSFTTGVVQLPLVLPFLLFYRDATVSALRTLCALRGIALAARRSGKAKAIIQAITAYIIILAMIPEALGWISRYQLQTLSVSVVGFCTAYTLYTGIDYFRAHWSHIQGLLRSPRKEAQQH